MASMQGLNLVKRKMADQLWSLWPESLAGLPVGIQLWHSGGASRRASKAGQQGVAFSWGIIGYVIACWPLFSALAAWGLITAQLPP